jgi:hypothetical protein
LDKPTHYAIKWRLASAISLAYLATISMNSLEERTNPLSMNTTSLTSLIRSYAPITRVRPGVVRPGTRIFGDSVAGGRAPD